MLETDAYGYLGVVDTWAIQHNQTHQLPQK